MGGRCEYTFKFRNQGSRPENRKTKRTKMRLKAQEYWARTDSLRGWGTVTVTGLSLVIKAPEPSI